MLSSSSSSNSSEVFVCEKAEDVDVKKKRNMDDPKENVGLLIRPCLSMEFNKEEEEEQQEHNNDDDTTSSAASATLLMYEKCEEEEVKTPPASPRKGSWECPGAPRKAKAKKRKRCGEGDDDDEKKIMAHSHLCRHLESLFPPAVNIKRLKQQRPITGS